MANDVLIWSKRRTPRWMNLSTSARGVAEGIAVALDDRGELSLGWRGLPGLVALIGRAKWKDECAGAIARGDRKPDGTECPCLACAVHELFDSRTYEYDAERHVIIDPQHVERQHRAVDGVPSTITAGRTPSMTKSAIRKREQRATKKFDETTTALSAQLTIGDIGRDKWDMSHDVHDVRATDPGIESQTHDVTPRSVAAARGTSDGTSVHPEAPTTTTSIISDQQKKSSRTAQAVVERGSPVPSDLRDLAYRLRPDLTDTDVERLWVKFADEHHGKPLLRKVLRSWVLREDPSRDVPKPAASQAPTQEPASRTTVDEVSDELEARRSVRGKLPPDSIRSQQAHIEAMLRAAQGATGPPTQAAVA